MRRAAAGFPESGAAGWNLRKILTAATASTAQPAITTNLGRRAADISRI
jgi:hypothetical protein